MRRRKSSGERGSTEALVSRARAVARRSQRGWGERDYISSKLGKEIALLTERIEQVRREHEHQVRAVVREETYIDSELLRLGERLPKYFIERVPSWNKLETRLGRLSKERRDLERRHRRELDTMLDRLLELMNKQDLLDEEHG